MPTVTCPRCRTAQPIDPGAAGYDCTVCGSHWEFVRCGECRTVFHAQGAAGAWTCNRCGHRNVATAPVHAPSAPAARIGDEDPPARERSAADLLRGLGSWWSSLHMYGKVAAVLLPIAVVALVFALTLGGGGNKRADALAALCHDELLLQTSFRVGAMSRLASRLPNDAQLFREAGDTADAVAVERLLAAVQNMISTLKAQGDIGPANAKMAQAVAGLPDCSSTG